MAMPENSPRSSNSSRAIQTGLSSSQESVAWASLSTLSCHTNSGVLEIACKDVSASRDHGVTHRDATGFTSVIA